MLNTISARQLQRDYKGVLQKANRMKRPLVVMSNNKPQGAIIGLDLLERLQLDDLVKQALKESREGKTQVIKTEEDLEKHFDEIDAMV